MRVVTAADLKYVAGVIALYNSFLEHMPGHEFTCLVHDWATQLLLEDKGIPYKWVDREALGKLPTTERWPDESAAMYSRLMIPDLFEEDHLVWLDADTLILKELPEIDLEDYPCGATVSWNATLGSQVVGLCVPRLEALPALQAGSIYFNSKVWREKKILQKCLEKMQMNYRYTFVVQSVLSFALEGDFAELPIKWNYWTSWGDLPHNTLVAHYCGWDYLPWTRKEMPHKDLWLKYYNEGEVFERERREGSKERTERAQGGKT